MVFDGYVNNDKLTKEVLKDNWFNTNDVVKVDNEGYYYIAGRLSDIKNYKQNEITLREIENILYKFDGIKRKIIELFNAYNFENEEEISNHFNLKFIEVLEDAINVNGYEIKSYVVSHGEEKPALGYVINNQLGLTGDTGICDGVERIVKQSKIIIADSSLINGDKCHMGVDNLQYLNTKYGKLIICTHLRDETRQYIKENSSIEGIKVLEDFEEINL